MPGSGIGSGASIGLYYAVAGTEAEIAKSTEAETEKVAVQSKRDLESTAIGFEQIFRTIDADFLEAGIHFRSLMTVAHVDVVDYQAQVSKSLGLLVFQP